MCSTQPFTPLSAAGTPKPGQCTPGDSLEMVVGGLEGAQLSVMQRPLRAF